MHLDDCVSAIMNAARNAREGQEVYNVASEDAIDLHEVIEAITEEMGIESPQINYTGAVSEGGGWPRRSTHSPSRHNKTQKIRVES